MRWTRSVVGDVALASVLVVVGVVGTFGSDARTGLDRPVDAVALALVVAAATSLVMRRRWPLATLAFVAVATSAYLLAGYPFGPILIVFFVAVYTVARHLPLRRSVPVSAAALVVLVAHVFTNEAVLPGLLGVVPATAWVVVPFAIGATVRSAAESAARAQAEAVRQRVDEERLRVAQEVHDVVGHGLAAIKMQADVALHVLARQPAQAEPALAAISRASAEALDDLRGTLGLLRGVDANPPRAPAASIDRIGDLCERMRDIGVAVTLHTSGEPGPVPSAVDLAAYRVVQEALTNVLRHSETKVADVEVCYEDDAIAVTVANPSPQPPDSDTGGLGIPGMRTRVDSVGGQLSAGPTAEGTFEVRAWMPTRSEP